MLGEVIKSARLAADITMEALADRIGITERYLYRIENEGKSDKSLAVIWSVQMMTQAYSFDCN